jgi:hypothetical protein
MTKPGKYWEQVIRLMESEGYSNMADELHLQMHEIHNKALKDAARKLFALSVVNVNGVRVVHLETAQFAILAGEVKE